MTTTTLQKKCLTSISLFIALTCFYILLGGGHIYTPDGVVMFRVAQSVTNGHTDINELENWPGFGVFKTSKSNTEEEKSYAFYGLAYSLMAVPLIELGNHLAPLLTDNERNIFNATKTPQRVHWDDWSPDNWPVPIQIFTASWLNAFLTAAWVTCFFLVGCELKFGEKASLVMALLAGLATPLSHYAQTFFSEPLAGLAFMLHYLLLLISQRKQWSQGYLFFSGLALGWVVLTKVALTVLCLPAVIYLIVLLLWSSTDLLSWTKKMRFIIIKGGALALGLAIPCTILLIYNYLRFNSVFETGYSEVCLWTTPFLEGIYGLLFSAGRGLLCYTPLIFVSIALAGKFSKSYLKEGIYCIAIFASILLLYAKWFMWEGGWCWGPRFLIPIIPFLLLPIGASLNNYKKWTTLGKLGFISIVLISLVISINGLLVNYIDYYQYLTNFYTVHSTALIEAGITHPYDLLRWEWKFSPLLAYWGFPTKDYLMLPYAIRQPGVVLGTYVIAATGCIISSIILAGRFSRK